MVNVEVQGEVLALLPERVVWRPSARTIFIADPHLGKGAAFRSLGIPVPEGTTAADLARLDHLTNTLVPERIIILGDLLHARSGRSAEVTAAFAAWRARWSEIRMLLVRGNHDEHAGDPPEEWRIECMDGPLDEGPFTLRHEPSEDEVGFALCGHLHPAVRLEGAAGASMRCPCFWLLRNHLVLPAFGSFTGMKTVRPTDGDRVFAVGDEVIEITALTLR